MVNKAQTSVLGARSVQAMGLVNVEYDHIQFITEGASTPLLGCTDMKQMVDANQEVFKGDLGQFPGDLHRMSIPLSQKCRHLYERFLLL